MGSSLKTSPTLSVVVVLYNIPREAPRTLYSLSAAYQRHISADEYEIIAVDNGSTPPVDTASVATLPGNFRLIRIEPASPSPAQAINRGISQARGDVIGVMIDGARLVTPGLLHFARRGAQLYPRAVVSSLGWYLGADLQKMAVEAGYDQAREDELLRSISWPEDGYRLFEIGTPDESSTDGWLQPLAESNGIFMRREVWDLLGGVDERFDLAGGGLLNLDTFRRAIELPGSEIVILLGEGTFHQLHGGTATNARLEEFEARIGAWLRQYEQIRGTAFRVPPWQEPTFIGTLPCEVLRRFTRAVLHPAKSARLPLGRSFNREFWAIQPPPKPADPTAALLVDLAHREFRAGRDMAAAAVSRLARSHFPEEPELQRLLSLIGPSLVRRAPRQPTPTFHAALGEAFRILGDSERASAEFRTALALKEDFAEAHIGLSRLRSPGVPYLVWLTRLHELLRPETYVEIGVHEGNSICRALPPTRAIGVDPAPSIKTPFKTETHIFAETSDDFFANRRLDSLLQGQPVALGFIDGLHLFEQALLDFVNLEPYCEPNSVILLHDTYPLDETTQQRVQRTAFYTGDVWKTVLCLKSFRPDLEIFTIATPWSGLTVVTGLDPRSRVLPENYDEAVRSFIDLSYQEMCGSLPEALNLVPNSWPPVADRLQSRLRHPGRR